MLQMDSQTAEATIKACLIEIGKNLEEAAAVAKAAVACAESGNTPKGVEIMLDIEQLAYEANSLLNAASLIKRLSET